MSTVLVVIGICLIIFGVIFGFLTSTLSGFLMAICVAVVLAVILFALSIIIENQADIKARLDLLNTVVKEPPEKITCRKCGRIYTSDRTSCPFCGIKTLDESNPEFQI